ncbi:MAG: hypothetical protein ACQETI_10160 [Halobacteriota archaeon]
MNVASAFAAAVMVLSGMLTVGTFYLIFRGPFLGQPMLDTVPLALAIAGFLVGLFVFTRSLFAVFGVSVRV